MKTKVKIILSSSLIIFAVFTSCKKTKSSDSTLLSREPVLPASSYQYNGNVSNETTTLGRVLFYEVQLSANNTVSCGTCHIQALGFSDGKKFSRGLADKLTERNTPGITNEAASRGLFWDSRAQNFEDLVLRPVTNHTEMGILDVNTLTSKLQNIKYYNQLFINAFGDNQVTIERIQLSMASFLSALQRPHRSKYEQGMAKQHANLNTIEQIGMDVFNQKGKCNSCHSLSFGWSDAANIGLELSYIDKGMGGLNGANQEAQEGVFRIPDLYNIALTGPYMHDGRFNTLEQVVEHYNSGVKRHKNLDWRLRNIGPLVNNAMVISDEAQKLNLTDLEKKGLVAFLKTLTDWEYTNDPRYNNPFIK